MKTNQNGTMVLMLGRSADVNYLNLAAAMIRGLPRVLRVRVDFDAGQLEILYENAADGLVQEIHMALLAAGREMSPLRA